MALLLWASPAQAQTICADWKEVTKRLGAKYKETPSARGLAGSKDNPDRPLVVVFTSPSGTFTITSVAPDGRTCLVVAGEDWETFSTNKGI